MMEVTRKELGDSLIKDDSKVIVFGSVNSGTTTTIVDESINSDFDDDAFSDYYVIFLTGDNAGLTSRITDYVKSTRTITFVDALTSVSEGDRYAVVTDLSKWQQDNIGDFLAKTDNATLKASLGLADASGSTVANAIGHDGSSDLDTGLMAQLQDYVTDDSDSIYDRLGDPTIRSNNTTILDIIGMDDTADATIRAGLGKEAVYYDATNGSTGTDYPLGTPEHPVSDEANALTIANNRNLRTIVVLAGSFSIPSTIEQYEFIGVGAIKSGLSLSAISMNGQDVSKLSFRNLTVGGTMGATVGGLEFHDCAIDSTLEPQSAGNGSIIAKNCTFEGSAGNALEDVNLINPRPLHVNGNGDEFTIHAESYIFINGAIGKVTVDYLDNGDGSVFMEGGTLTIGSNCSGSSSVDVFGDCDSITNNSPGTVTVNDYTQQGRDKGLNRISDAVSKGTGTEIVSDKSLVDAIGHDGSADLDSGLMAQLQDYVTDDSDSIYNRIGDFTSLSNKPSLLQVLGASGYDGDNSTIYDIQGNILMTLGDPSGYSNLTTILQVLGGSSFDADNRTLFQNVVGSATSGTVTYGDVGGEQDIINKSPSTLRKVDSIWFDTTAMTQSGTVKLYYKIDGTNERLIDSWSLTASDEGSHIPQHTFSQDWRVTYEEDSDETADRNIPWSIEYGDDK